MTEQRGQAFFHSADPIAPLVVVAAGERLVAAEKLATDAPLVDVVHAHFPFVHSCGTSASRHADALGRG